MLFAEISLSKKNHIMTEEDYIFRTIFGNVFVKRNKVVRNNSTVLVPNECFGKQGYNPCQMVNGFLGFVSLPL
jgi:hypothetical protein